LNSTIPPPKGKKADPLIGSVVAGKFKVLSLVAAGGMGKVYRAEQMPLGRAVALKVLHINASDVTDEGDPQFKKRFLREASILAKLQHPNIVTVFDYGAIEGEHERYFMAMEFLSGETLTRRIADRVALPARDTIKVARQLARGLSEAHASGVIHRDLKPSNVMLLAGRDGEDLVKIVDFGIVKLVGDDSVEKEELTQEGSFIGSPKYMAPEQITRGGKIDARTDVYSFGIILYQCLTGTVPFDGASSVQTLMAHLNQAPQPMKERNPSLDVPEWLDELVMTCIEKEPGKRPQTMESVARTFTDAEAMLNSGRILTSMNAQAAASRSSRPSVPDTLSSGPLQAAPPSAAGKISITTQGTIASVSPPPPSGDDKTRTSPGIKKAVDGPSPRSYIVGAAAIASALALGFVLLRPKALPDPASVSASVSAQATTAAAPAPSDEFALTIESVPSGADVREGDRVLGTTPLLVTVDNDSVRVTPRAFTVSKDGYAPYALAQGASRESVRLVAPLVALAALAPTQPPSVATPAPGAGAHVGGSGKRAASPKPAPSASASSRPDLDIRMNR
jgi:serine/threonine-protein kinase